MKRTTTIPHAAKRKRPKVSAENPGEVEIRELRREVANLKERYDRIAGGLALLAFTIPFLLKLLSHRMVP